MVKKAVVLLVSFGLTTMLCADAYEKCATCHGKNGEKEALKKSKVIADMTKAEIVSSLKGYQANSSNEPMKKLMAAQVKNLSEADIEAIAQKIGK